MAGWPSASATLSGRCVTHRQQRSLEHVGRPPGPGSVPSQGATTGDLATVLELNVAGLVPVNVNTLLARELRRARAPEPPDGVQVREIDGPRDTELGRRGGPVVFTDPLSPGPTGARRGGRPRSSATGSSATWKGLAARRRTWPLRDGRPGRLPAACWPPTPRRVIDLMGVAPSGARPAASARHSHGRFVAESANRCQIVRVGTQAANPGSDALLRARRGFRGRGRRLRHAPSGGLSPMRIGAREMRHAAAAGG